MPSLILFSGCLYIFLSFFVSQNVFNILTFSSFACSLQNSLGTVIQGACPPCCGCHSIRGVLGLGLVKLLPSSKHGMSDATTKLC